MVSRTTKFAFIAAAGIAALSVIWRQEDLSANPENIEGVLDKAIMYAKNSYTFPESLTKHESVRTLTLADALLHGTRKNSRFYEYAEAMLGKSVVLSGDIIKDKYEVTKILKNNPQGTQLPVPHQDLLRGFYLSLLDWQCMYGDPNCKLKMNDIPKMDLNDLSTAAYESAALKYVEDHPEDILSAAGDAASWVECAAHSSLMGGIIGSDNTVSGYEITPRESFHFHYNRALEMIGSLAPKLIEKRGGYLSKEFATKDDAPGQVGSMAGSCMQIAKIMLGR